MILLLKRLFLQFLALSIFLTVQSVYGSESCHSIFSNPLLRKSEVMYTTGLYKGTVAELDSRIVDIKLKENLLSAGVEGRYPVILVKREYDSGLAYLYYRRIPNADAIIIDMVEVPTSLRGKGISMELFKSVFDLEPNIKKVVFELDKTNKEVFDQNKLLTLEDRLKRTPIFKSLQKLGFAMIEHVSEHRLSGKTFPHVVLSRE